VTSRPGVVVQLQELPSPISFPSDTGTWFVAGTSDRGSSTQAQEITSLADFVNTYGARQTYSVLYDALETFFREGGSHAYVARVVGPAAASGTHNLLDASAGVSLIVTALGPGAWSANYKVGVVNGVASGTYQIQITDASNNVLEQSSDLGDQGSAVAWSNYSNYVRITLGASALLPAVVAPAALSAGNDDRNNITDAQWATALTLFSPALGPGQVSEPGRTSSTAYNQVKAHVESNGRVGLLDLPDSPTVATLQAAAAGVSSRFCAAFGPWAVVSGLTTGTTRTVPPTALIAGMIARNDPSLGANQPAAGNYGQAQFVIDLSQPDWNDTQRTTLNSSSCNIVRRMFGAIRNYGWRSLTNAISDPSWVDFGNARFYTELVAELDLIGENYIFSEIDGLNGVTMTSFHTSLAACLMAHYAAGELFGDTADQAFSVDTGPSVNTPQTIANNELHATCMVVMSPFAEQVFINIVKNQVTAVSLAAA